MVPRTLHMLSKDSATELYPQLWACTDRAPVSWSFTVGYGFLVNLELSCFTSHSHLTLSGIRCYIEEQILNKKKGQFLFTVYF